MKKEILDRMTPEARQTVEDHRFSFTLIESGENAGRMRCVAYSKKDGPALRSIPQPVLQEIKEALIEENEQKKAVAALRKARREAIPGVKEIETARAEIDEAFRAFNRAMDSEDGRPPAPYTGPGTKELSKRFPEAAALLKAEDWTYSSNYAKAAAVERAVKAILEDGADPIGAIAAMKKEFDDYCHEHMWD